MTTNELDFIRTYASIQKRTAEFRVKLGAMRDMSTGCKLGVSEINGALYVDKPSMFQGASRWFYGQNRHVVNDCLHREVMEKGGLIDLVVNLRDKCSELFMRCPDINSPQTTQTPHQAIRTYYTVFISENTRKLFRTLCLTGIELLTIVAHGLGILSHIYEPEPDYALGADSAGALNTIYKSALTQFHEPPSRSSSEAVIRTIQDMQCRIKFERLMLESVVDKFKTILN